MKILMFSADPMILDARSAAAKRMIEYGKRIEKLDILVLTSHLDAGLKNEIELAENARIYALTGKFSRFFKAFFKARSLLKRIKYDLLVAQDVEHAFLCWLLSLRFKTAWQMQIHADIFSLYFARHSFFNKMRIWFAKFLIPRASCIRVVSQRIKKSILKAQSLQLKANIEVLPILASPINTDAQPKRFPEFDKNILMVSRLTSEKNIGLAIDAMAEVVKKHPKTGLVIVGDGPEFKNIKNQISNLKIDENVRLEGWRENIASYYKGSDIFILTSWYEGWGMSAVEAMRYGAAVVMTDVGLAGELIEDGKSGLIVPVGDKNALAAAILRLLENDSFRRDLIEEAAKKTGELFSVEEYYQKIIDSWSRCVG
ncbi:MAG: glycosyltransferase [Patescibacteria group bacterium]